MKASEILRIGLESLGPNGHNWIGGPDDIGLGVNCMSTALLKAGPSDNLDAANWFLADAIGVDHLYEPIYKWNDTPGRTFAEVKAKYLEAIALAEASEAVEVNAA